MDKEQEAEQLRAARLELAGRLCNELVFALASGLSSEAVIIEKIIETTLTNTTTHLYIKLTS